MNYPLWGLEPVVERIVAGLGDGTRSGLIEIVAEQGAAGTRVLRSMLSEIATAGTTVHEAPADELSSLHPGSLADDLRGDDDPGGRVVLAVSDAHLADAASMATLARRLADDPSTTLIIARDQLEGPALRPFTNLQRMAAAAGTSESIAVARPSVDDIAQALDLEYSAAQALHNATRGDDGELIEILNELTSDRESGSPSDLSALLENLATRAVPLGHLSDLDKRIAELVAVSISPLATPVLATATDQPEREVLDAIERLTREGLIADTPQGIQRPSGPRATTLQRALTSSRTTAANRDLAEAISNTETTPGIEVAFYYERAGDYQAAFARFQAAGDQAAADSRDAVAAAAVDRALNCLESGATTDATTRGRLLLTRGMGLRASAYSDLALADLEEASSLLTGNERINALGFLAAVLDDQQRPQQADVAIAVAEWEAFQQGAQEKLGSLLTLRARTAARVGFAAEADQILEKGVDLIALHGTSRQKQNAKNNRAWMAFDRGRAANAEQLFAELREASGDATTAVDATAWHARALAMRGWATDSVAALAEVESHRDDPTTTGAQFLAAIGAHELAMRTGRFEDALQAAGAELGFVTLFLPAWENGTRYRQADALRALGRLDEAAEAIESSIALSPPGADGLRWRVRAESLQLRIAHQTDGTWDKSRAENVTDVLLHANWYGGAAELMAYRAVVEKDEVLAADTAALAMSLGDPVTAAAAGSATSASVAQAVQSLQARVPEDWQESWRALPGIDEALAQEPPAEDAEPDWHGQLNEWLGQAGLANPDSLLSPAQRRAGGMVRRRPEPRRWGVVALAAAIASVVAVVGVIALLPPEAPPTTTTAVAATTTATTAAPTTTTTLPLEARVVEADELLAGTFAYRGGTDRSGIVESIGVTEPVGTYAVVDTANPVRSDPAVFGQKAYVGGEDGVVHIIDFVSGRQSSARMTDEIRAPVVVARIALGGVTASNVETIVYAADRRGRVIAIKSDLSEFGRAELDADITAAPVVTEDAVIILTGGSQGRIVAFSHDLGEELWSFPGPEDEPLDTGFTFTAPVGGGFMYAAADSGVVYAIDLGSGEMKCSYDAKVPVSAGAMTTGGKVWIPAGTAIHVLEVGLCVAPLDPPTQVQVGVRVQSTPVVVGDTMFVSSNLLMIALDLAAEPGTSGELWAVDTGGPIQSSPVYANGILYFGSDDGYVYAVDTIEGFPPLWKFDTGGPVQSSVAVIDGAIVATNNNGRIVVIAGALETASS